MPSFFRQLLIPLFFLLFLLSVFLIEGSFKFYLFALWAAFFAIFFIWDASKKSAKEAVSKSVFLSIILIFAAAVNLIFSNHQPLSLEKAFFYLVVVASFIFFRSLDKKATQINLFLYYLSLSTLVLNLFVLFFTFTNPEADLFTGMNLLIRSYGHNHYAAYLLLVLPVFWWQLLFAKKESWAESKEIKLLAVALLMSSYILVIFSLARVVMILALAQLLLVFLINRRQLLQSAHSELNQALVKAFLFSFTAVIAVFFILSLPLNQKGEQLCPLLFKQKDLCKPWLQNDRLLYWQKAWWLFTEEPIFGVGLKNFGFASRQLPIASYSQTAYAHNIFLHNLAEGGLVFGGLFIFYILYLFKAAFKVVRGGEPLLRLLWLAGATSLANAFFDFDWHFFVIFSLTLIFLALILRESGEADMKLPSKTQGSDRIIKFFFIFSLITTLLMALAFFGANLLRKQGQIDALVKYFPLVDRQIRHAMNEQKLSAQNFADLEKPYLQDPDFLQKYLQADAVTSVKKVELWLNLAKLDPLTIVNKIKLEEFSYAEVAPLADEILRVSRAHGFIDNTLFVDYWRQRNLAVDFFYFANQAYVAGDLMTAAKLFSQAVIFNPHIFSDLKPVFLEETDLSRAANFFANFQNSNPESMPDFYTYIDLYQRTLLHLYENDRLAEFYALTDKILEPLPNHAWFLVRDLIDQSQTTEEKARLQEVYGSLQHLEAWQDFLPLPV